VESGHGLLPAQHNHHVCIEVCQHTGSSPSATRVLGLPAQRQTAQASYVSTLFFFDGNNSFFKFNNNNNNNNSNSNSNSNSNFTFQIKFMIVFSILKIFFSNLVIILLII